MKFKRLGKWGLPVGTLGLGSWVTFGDKVDEAASVRIIQHAYEKGIRLFDTANSYSRDYASGHRSAELLLGQALKGYRRDQFVLVTKVGSPTGKSEYYDRGLHAKNIRHQCEESLRALQTDYLDIYMCHCSDPAVPLEEIVWAMDDLARQGKILYWGGEWPADMIQRANGIARATGARPIAAVEHRYNLLFRHPEIDLFPTFVQEGIGTLAFSPLAQGVLTGKYKPGTTPTGGRATKQWGNYMRKMYYSEANLQRVEKMGAIAAQMGVATSHLALAWLLHQPTVSTAIFGATTAEQVDDNLPAADLELPAEVLKQLDELFPRPEIVQSVGDIPQLV